MGEVGVLLVTRSSCGTMITSGVQQWGKAQVTKSCFDVWETIRMDVHWDKPISGLLGQS